jgi:hypothetical protein
VRSPRLMPSMWRSNAHATVGAAVVPMLVATPPGQTALQRIPCGEYVNAMCLVSPMRAC